MVRRIQKVKLISCHTGEEMVMNYVMNRQIYVLSVARFTDRNLFFLNVSEGIC